MEAGINYLFSKPTCSEQDHKMEKCQGKKTPQFQSFTVKVYYEYSMLEIGRV